MFEVLYGCKTGAHISTWQTHQIFMHLWSAYKPRPYKGVQGCTTSKVEIWSWQKNFFYIFIQSHFSTIATIVHKFAISAQKLEGMSASIYSTYYDFSYCQGVYIVVFIQSEVNIIFHSRVAKCLVLPDTHPMLLKLVVACNVSHTHHYASGSMWQLRWKTVIYI